MKPARFPHLSVELRRIALARALRSLAPAQLDDAAVRMRAYARAGLSIDPAQIPADDADARRRNLLFLAHVAPAGAVLPAPCSPAASSGIAA